MQTLSLVLTIEETNTILRALAELRYREVHELVANVRAQAERQLAVPLDADGAHAAAGPVAS